MNIYICVFRAPLHKVLKYWYSWFSSPMKFTPICAPRNILNSQYLMNNNQKYENLQGKASFIVLFDFKWFKKFMQKVQICTYTWNSHVKAHIQLLAFEYNQLTTKELLCVLQNDWYFSTLNFSKNVICSYRPQVNVFLLMIKYSI